MERASEKELFERTPVHKAVAALTALYALLSFCFQEPLLWLLGASPENMGYARPASAGMMLGGILNMLLDPLFIYGLHMEFLGAAVATALSNLASGYGDIAVAAYPAWIIYLGFTA